MKHTPGPWFYSGDGLTHRQFDIYAPARSPNQHIATVNNLSVEKLRTRDAEEAIGNARLIAAAPDMLAAVSLVVDGDGKPDECPRIMSAARAALAKARGDE